MARSPVTLLLLVALVSPVALFSLAWPHLHWDVWVAAAVAIAVGWALNVAWAVASQHATTSDASPDDAKTLSIATRFGWACSAVLVLLTWLAWRFVA